MQYVMSYTQSRYRPSSSTVSVLTGCTVVKEHPLKVITRWNQRDFERAGHAGVPAPVTVLHWYKKLDADDLAELEDVDLELVDYEASLTR